MSIETYHIPVMLEECIEALAIDPNGTYVDLTMGGGGHTREILSHLGAKGHLYSLDQDPDAVSNAPHDERHTFVASNFRFVRGALRHRGVEQVDGILADLGVSSHHFDAKHRGFSFRGDAPLDMRMNTREGRTAADIVNTYTNDALAKIFAEYGELVKPCTPPKDEAKFLTKLFQALRIELNGEMEALKMALEQSLKLLKPGGRLVVMSYHSLEDRIVKNFMRSGNTEGVIEKDFFGRATTPFKVITRKAVVPSDEEIEINPRSRSAKLRVAERIAE